jgi:hypothetical protein
VQGEQLAFLAASLTIFVLPCCWLLSLLSLARRFAPKLKAEAIDIIPNIRLTREAVKLAGENVLRRCATIRPLHPWELTEASGCPSSEP